MASSRNTQSYLILYKPNGAEIELLVCDKLILNCMTERLPGRPVRTALQRIQDFGQEHPGKTSPKAIDIYKKLLRKRYNILFPGPGLLTYPGGKGEQEDQEASLKETGASKEPVKISIFDEESGEEKDYLLPFQEVNIAKHTALREFYQEFLLKELEEIPQLGRELRSKMQPLYARDYVYEDKRKQKKVTTRSYFFFLSEEEFLSTINKYWGSHKQLQSLFKRDAAGLISMQQWMSALKAKVDASKAANLKNLKAKKEVDRKHADIEVTHLQYLPVTAIEEYYNQPNIKHIAEYKDIEEIATLIENIIKLPPTVNLASTIKEGIISDYRYQAKYILGVTRKLSNVLMAKLSAVSSALLDDVKETLPTISPASGEVPTGLLAQMSLLSPMPTPVASLPEPTQLPSPTHP